MPKINQEEYEVLKEKSSGGYEWIARDESGSCFVFELKPIKDHRAELWEWVGSTRIGKIFNSSLFQFIQWEDEEPHSIAELIEEYEEEVELKEQISVVMDRLKEACGIAMKEVGRVFGGIGLESEETEVKSIQDLIDKWDNYKNVARTVANSRAIEHADMFINDLEQLDEPDEREQLETAYKDILNRGEFWFDDKEYKVVPKQEEVKVSKTWHDVIAQNKKEGHSLRWTLNYIDNLNVNDVDDFAKAWLAYPNIEVEEEQKYQVKDNHGRTLLAKMTYSYKGKTFEEVQPYNELIQGYEKELTEQEIKDYDERFWPFAVPVEELEE